MLTRRGFVGVATCAICSAAGFIATDASAQGAPVATTPGVTRKILSQTDGPMPGYVTIIAEAEIEPGIMVARHTHPGIESSYILEGNIELPVEGQPTRMVKAGEAFQIPPYTRMLAENLPMLRYGSQAPMSWKRASRSHLQPDSIAGALELERSPEAVFFRVVKMPECADGRCGDLGLGYRA